MRVSLGDSTSWAASRRCPALSTGRWPIGAWPSGSGPTTPRVPGSDRVHRRADHAGGDRRASDDDRGTGERDDGRVSAPGDVSADHPCGRADVERGVPEVRAPGQLFIACVRLAGDLPHRVSSPLQVRWMGLSRVSRYFSSSSTLNMESPTWLPPHLKVNRYSPGCFT